VEREEGWKGGGEGSTEKKISQFLVYAASFCGQGSNLRIIRDHFLKLVVKRAIRAVAYFLNQVKDNAIVAAGLVSFYQFPEPGHVLQQILAREPLVMIDGFYVARIPAHQGAAFRRTVFVYAALVGFFIQKDACPSTVFPLYLDQVGRYGCHLSLNVLMRQLAASKGEQESGWNFPGIDKMFV
jgi:hypothetical protein